MSSIDIEFASNDSGKVHEFYCQVPKSFKEKFEFIVKDTANKNDMLVIDNAIKNFNIESGNIITDYEYVLLSDIDISVSVLFKHLFKSLKEPQHYAKCKIRTEGNTKIMIKMSDKIQSKLKIPPDTERLPISSILAECIDIPESNMVKLSIRFETIKSKCTMKNFETVITFITEGLYDAFERANDFDGTPI